MSTSDELRAGESLGYLGLGTNVGDRRLQLQTAIDALGRHGVRVLASSATYDTDPVGDVLDQPDFLNACIRIATTLRPEELLDACKAVEREHGRTTDVTSPDYVRHGPRPIDVDLLLLGDEAYRSDRLTLPHAQVAERRFVLVPLLELDLGLALPNGTRLAERLEQLPLDEGVRRAGDPLDVPPVA
jgi:2-amino-4-hydroxy-6-hydroxymethyldihydropteridine diphosphokinase